MTDPVSGKRTILSRDTVVPIGVMLVVAGLVWHAGQILRDMNTIITTTNQAMLDRVEERYVSKEVFNLRMDALGKSQEQARAEQEKARAELAEFRKEFRDYVEGARTPR